MPPAFWGGGRRELKAAHPIVIATAVTAQQTCVEQGSVPRHWILSLVVTNSLSVLRLGKLRLGKVKLLQGVKFREGMHTQVEDAITPTSNHCPVLPATEVRAAERFVAIKVL